MREATESLRIWAHIGTQLPRRASARPRQLRNDQAPTLERNIFVADRRCRCWLRFRCALIEVVSSGSSARATREVSTTFSASAQQNQIVGHDFRHVLFLVGLLIVPGAGLETTFDIHLAALLQIFAGAFRKAMHHTTFVDI